MYSKPFLVKFSTGRVIKISPRRDRSTTQFEATNKINEFQLYEYFFEMSGNIIFGETLDDFTARDRELFNHIESVQYKHKKMKNSKKYFLKTFYFWNKICLLYPQYFIFWDKMFNKYFPTINLTKPKSVSKFMSWPFSALVKYLAWCVRVHIYNLPFQAIAFYFEYTTQNFYSVLYIPEIIAALYFVSFPFSMRLVAGLFNDLHSSSQNSLEIALKSLSSLFSIQDTQKRMWLVPLLLAHDKMISDSRGRRGRVFFAYLEQIVIIFLVSIGSWLPIIPFIVSFVSNNYSYKEDIWITVNTLYGFSTGNQNFLFINKF